MGNKGNFSDLISQFITDNFLFGDGKDLNPDTPLFEKGIIDSTGILELVAFIEDSFEIKVNDDELVMDNFSTIGNIEQFLLQKTA